MLRWLLLRAYRLPSRPSPPEPASLGLHAEDRTLCAEDGSRLRAWLVAPPPDAATHRPGPAVVLTHGWGSHGGDLLPVVPPLLAAGLTVLLLDVRGHGRSDTVEFMSMPRFAADIEVALDELRADPNIDPDRLGLVGHSVGAGASLLAAARDPRVGAVVSLACLAHPAELMARTPGARLLPTRLLAAARRTVETTIAADLDDIAPLTSITRGRSPVLLVHGLDDTTVPPTDATRLADRGLQAGRPVALRLIAGADHRSLDTLLPVAAEAAAFLRRSLEPTLRPVSPVRDVAGGPPLA